MILPGESPLSMVCGNQAATFLIVGTRGHALHMAKGTGSPVVPADIAACLEGLDVAGTAQGTVLRRDRQQREHRVRQTLEWEAERYGLFAIRELVVISDGAGWIRNVCEELFSGRAVTYILNFFTCRNICPTR